MVQSRIEIVVCGWRAPDADGSRARCLHRDLEELFPGEASALITASQCEIIQAIQNSENFFEHLADLRAALRTIYDTVGQRYAETKQQYEEQLTEARKALEGSARWLDLTSEDRQDIGGRLTLSDVPDVPRPGRELADLRLLLTRRTGLAALVDALKHEVN